MSLRSNRNELQRLLAAWCNDTISSEEVDRLEELLHDDPMARQTYLEYATTEAELHSTFADSFHSELEDEGVALATFKPILDARDGFQQKNSHGWNSTKWMFLAASLIGVAVVSSWVTWQAAGGDAHERLAMGHEPSDQTSGNTHQQKDSKFQNAVARVTGTRNCRWGSGHEKIGFSSDLFHGQRVELLAGVAEITFDSGATVILEGPSRLNLGSGHDAVLEQGRLAVTLPASAENNAHSTVRLSRLGITLASNASNKEGLHYGLSADGSGHEEVHVFRGDLQTYLLDKKNAKNAKPNRMVLLHPQEAARVKPASTTLAKFYADKDKFVRSISTGVGPHDGLYAYDGFDYPAGPLSGQNGGFGWAGAWADIEAACPPGEIATNVVKADSLRYDKALHAMGGHAVQRAQQNRIRRALSTSLGGVFDSAGLVENQDGLRLVGANGRAVYLSFLQRVDRVDDGFYGVELHRGDGNPNRVLCVGNGAEGSGYGVTSNYNAYGRENYAKLGQENDQANLIVVKIEYGQQHRDRVTVYRNPESLHKESELTVDAELVGNFAFDRISFGDFDGQKVHEVDELRIGTTYEAVVGRRHMGTELLTPIIAGQEPRDAFPLLSNDLTARPFSFFALILRNQ